MNFSTLMLVLMVTFHTEEFRVNVHQKMSCKRILWLSHSQLFFLVEMFQCRMYTSVRIHFHLPQSNLFVKKQFFNYRLSRMRRISKNGFGILANRWRVFRRPLMLEPEKVKIVPLCAITLHNRLREEGENGKIYIPIGLIDHENILTGEIFEASWRGDAVQGKIRFLSNTVFLYSYNLMMTITNGLKMYKINITVSVGLFL